MVFRRCHKLLNNESLAHEAMQDVFVQILRKKERLTFDTPSSLLYRMATNICLNIIKARHAESSYQHEGETDLVSRIANADDPESQIHATKLLEQLFKRVPESSRTIAYLHLVDGLTLAEVAAEVKMSVSGVRKRLRKLSHELIELSEL